MTKRPGTPTSVSLARLYPRSSRLLHLSAPSPVHAAHRPSANCSSPLRGDETSSPDLDSRQGHFRTVQCLSSLPLLAEFRFYVSGGAGTSLPPRLFFGSFSFCFPTNSRSFFGGLSSKKWGSSSHVVRGSNHQSVRTRPDTFSDIGTLPSVQSGVIFPPAAAPCAGLTAIPWTLNL